MSKIPGVRERSIASGVSFVIGAEVADVINVAIQVTGEKAGEQGVNLGEVLALLAYWSDDAGGDGLGPISAAHSGGTAIGTAGTLAELIADQVFLLITDLNGAINIDVTHVGAKTANFVVAAPDGRVFSSVSVVHA